MKKLSMSRKNVYKRIKRSNEKFAAMSKAEKRVQIAKDVLLQIEAKRIKPQAGVYIQAKVKNTFAFGKEWDDPIINEKEQVQDTLKNATCDACALGSMFICAVDRHDRLRIKNLNTFAVSAYPKDKNAEIELGGSDMYDYLSKFFSSDQLVAIEDAFEGDYKDISSDKKRLKAIMNNIIKNNGKFVRDDIVEDEDDTEKLTFVPDNPDESNSEEAPF